MNYPVPTAIKLQNGNPGHRPLNYDEPKALPADPTEIPAYLNLSDEDKAEWAIVAPPLAQLGLLSNIDLGSLGTYVQDRVDARKLRQAIRLEGFTISFTDKRGNESIRKNNKVTALNELTKRIREFENLFGMNPVSRSRIHITKEAPSDKPDVLAFINGKSA